VIDPAKLPIPVIGAVKLSEPPKIDGKLNDAVWQNVPGWDGFFQVSPDPGTKPTQHTTVKIAYDEKAVYVAFRCDDDDPATLVNRLTRRDRFIDADYVAVELDSLGDKTNAYGFIVYSSGTQVDYLRTGDNAQDTNWDAVWDSAVQVDEHGYSAEIAIPLGQLRFKAGVNVSMRVNFARFITRREETDTFVYLPPDAQGILLRMATLSNMHDLPESRGLELRPFVLGKFDHRYSPGPGYDPPSGNHPGLAAGGDVTYHPTRDLVLDATVLPDFGQVEADQVVLNLTTFETFFPEKRPFFLSGADLFALHDEAGNALQNQLFYSRRIGNPPAPPYLLDGQRLLDLPVANEIIGAAKLTGKVSEHLNIALLDAASEPEYATVQNPDGSTYRQRVAALSNFGVARLRADLPGNITAGAMVTTVNRHDVGLSGPGGCPSPDGNYYSPAPDGRCTSDAYAAALDANWSSDNGDYVASAQLLSSLREHGPDLDFPDGTAIHSGDLGYGGRFSVAKAGGSFFGRLLYEGYSPKLDFNDAGYLRQQNLHHVDLRGGYRTVNPWGPTLYTESDAEAQASYSTDGVLLNDTVTLSEGWRWTNHWFTYIEGDVSSDYFDNRETRDGAFYQRTFQAGGGLVINSDQRKPVSGDYYGFMFNTRRGYQAVTGVDLNWNLLGRIELGLSPQLNWSDGDPRWTYTEQIDPSNPGDRVYHFSDLDARATSIVFRGTYSFTHRLTLQAYAQVFLETLHYGESFRYNSSIPQPHIYQNLFVPEATPPGLDGKDGAVNVNVVLRWEYLPGSTLYLVYTRAQTQGDPTLDPDPRKPDLKALQRGPVDDVFLVKASYYFGL
jgi:hypothetical protein